MQIDPLAVVSVVVPATAALSVFIGYFVGRGIGRVHGLQRAKELVNRTESIWNARSMLLIEIQKEKGCL